MSNFNAFGHRPALVMLTAFLSLSAISDLRAEGLSALASRGYSVLPVPQQLSLGSKDFTLTDGWQLLLDRGIKADELAVESLKERWVERFHMTLAEGKTSRGGTGIIRLSVAPGSVAIGEATDKNKNGLSEQAYRLSLKPQEITLNANAAPGLFYGVQTLVQMGRPEGGR
jgi:hexosaminidase